MKCEELQFNLPLYIDDVLTDDERSSVEKHLPTCPLCRQKLTEYRELRNNLRVMSQPAIPADLLKNVRSAVSAKTSSPQPMFSLLFTESIAERVKQFLMPYSIATFASLVIGISLLFLIDSPESNTLEVALNNSNPTESSVLLANSNSPNIGEDLSLNSDGFERIALADRPPSINPTGALVALTKSFVRGKMKDEEVVIVADVFGNGLAKVAEVVEPPKNAQTMAEIQKALETDPEDAPFLPAKADNRSEKVTFILKIQRVDVVDSKRSTRKTF